LCAVPSFLEIGPRQARSGYWRAQVIAAAVLQHYAGKRQPVLVVERQVANAGITPPPLAETVMGRRVALEAEFNPRFIGTSWGVIYKTGLREGGRDEEARKHAGNRDIRLRRPCGRF